jgi:uncharacterized protein YjhX (UPF0386 family)
MSQEPKLNNIAELKEVRTKERKGTCWYLIRGWSVKFLEKMQHSGGLTSREIADGTQCKMSVATVILQRMKRYNVIERITGWGWRITSDGISFLLSKNNNNNINYINSLQTNKQQTSNSEKVETPERAPSCFSRAFCHIKLFCKEKVFNRKNEATCGGCCSNDTKNFTHKTELWQVVKVST